ncbi:Dps family protein [Mariniblastus fucicola]|uniref:Fine tangled pili major subunit n=1 Tax=Mariniblastus fucicola TaxID=980251 RepID=A0A5B9PGD6_9BACT|nr:DNA starvation/stationary phase protection protein [Mariniblastus fucicola]QEG24669.1 Fine tangled pili major subunit [Mariniblastus fucicola]
MTTKFKRNVLGDDSSTDEVKAILQSSLETLIDLALSLKQAHWNVVGPNFRSVHLQLDEIIITVREATDEIAERIVTIGHSPDGRAATVAAGSELPLFEDGFLKVDETISAVADRMKCTVDLLRTGISKVGELDPVSEDLLIGISAPLEKHLWMVQAQEVR